MKKQSIAFAALMSLSASLFAGEASVTPFVSGEAATAASVNAAFDALVTAINDNNSRIAALESASGTGSESPSVSGAQYEASVLGVQNRGSTTDSTTILGNYLQTYTLTFNADATCTFVGQAQESEVGLDGSVDGFTDPVTLDCTYTQTGSNLAITIVGEGVNDVIVSSDGSTMMGYFFTVEPDTGTYTRAETNLFVGVRKAQ